MKAAFQHKLKYLKTMQKILNRRTFVLAGLAVFAPRSALAGTVELDTAFGLVSAPVEPERIVALDVAAALAANYGKAPVGVTSVSQSALTETGSEILKSIPVVGHSTYGGQLRYEAILALRPDLIVGMVRSGVDHTALYRKLSLIAPTVLVQSAGAQGLLETSEELAVAMGLEEQAQADREAYQARVSSFRSRWSKTMERGPIAVISGRDRQILVQSSISWTGRIFRDIGASLPSVAITSDANGIQLSYEQIDQLKDVRGFVYPTHDSQPLPGVQEVLELPGFQRLDAVVSGSMLGLDDIWPENYRAACRFLDGLNTLMEKLEA